jgi:hypothetical protein
MEVSGQLHAKVALPAEPIDKEAGLDSDPIWT